MITPRIEAGELYNCPHRIDGEQAAGVLMFSGAGVACCAECYNEVVKRIEKEQPATQPVKE